MDNLHKRLPLALLAAYFSKVLILGATPSDVGVLIVLACSAAFHEAWSHLNENKVIREDLKSLDLRLKEAEKADQEIRSFLATQKMTQGMRPTFTAR